MEGVEVVPIERSDAVLGGPRLTLVIGGAEEDLLAHEVLDLFHATVAKSDLSRLQT